MTTNEIPTATEPVLTLALKVLAGAQAHGEDTGLKHNTATHLGSDLYDLTGDPATPTIPGKTSVFAARKGALAQAYVANRVTAKRAQEFCRVAIALLKSTLGTRYNADWKNAGFLAPSLAVPRKPAAMLVQFRQYFVANPTRENAAASITAAQAQALVEEFQATTLGVANARKDLRTAKAARDAAFQQLRKRLSGLRAELAQLLDPTSGRWEQIGFRRPAGARIPSAVPEVTVAPGGSGVVLVKWEHAPLADNYRVSWRQKDDPTGWVGAGIYTERQCALTELPTGASIIVGVSARNDAGETKVTEAGIEVI